MNDTDTTRRDALARALCSRISDQRRTVDELRVLDVILTRVSGGGFDQYGGLVIADDQRCFRKEAAEEFADALWYMAADVVRKVDESRSRIETGLTELRRSSQWPDEDHGLDHLFDVGGESE